MMNRVLRWSLVACVGLFVAGLPADAKANCKLRLLRVELSAEAGVWLFKGDSDCAHVVIWKRLGDQRWEVHDVVDVPPFEWESKLARPGEHLQLQATGCETNQPCFERGDKAEVLPLPASAVFHFTGDRWKDDSSTDPSAESKGE